MVRSSYLDAAAVAVDLLAEPTVADAWSRPSALPKMSVGALAAHLSRQITRVVNVLDTPAQPGPPTSIIDHYGQSDWVGADLDSEPNVGVRERSEQDAAAGADGVLALARDALAELRRRLPEESADRLVQAPWMRWPMTLDDFLVTRMLEISVHCDDVAVSVGVETPALPAAVIEPVIDVLSRLAVRRHGATAVLRALSRAERAPATIAAI